jgi:hypothetical protein
MIRQLFHGNNIKRIANVDEFIVDLTRDRPLFRDRYDIVKIKSLQLERKKGDVLLNETP